MTDSSQPMKESALKPYSFTRYRCDPAGGVMEMAEGIEVHAYNLEGAIAKAMPMAKRAGTDCLVYVPPAAVEGEQVPVGWMLVPIEPTEAMHEAANREWDGRMSARSRGVWQAMLAASPRAHSGRSGGIGPPSRHRANRRTDMV